MTRGSDPIHPRPADSGEGQQAERGRACPTCGAMIDFLSWPGEETCLSCGDVVYVNSTGQIGLGPQGELPDP